MHALLNTDVYNHRSGCIERRVFNAAMTAGDRLLRNELIICVCKISIKRRCVMAIERIIDQTNYPGYSFLCERRN